jgi:hypothetical protein
LNPKSRIASVNTTEQYVLPGERASPRSSAGKTFQQVFSFPVLLGALLVAAVFFGTLSQGTKTDTLFSEGDTWWLIRAGEEILATHRMPHTDSYSWTAAGTPWIAYEWLGETGMAGAYRAGRLQGLRFLQLALAGTMLALLYIYATMRCGNSKAAFAVCAVIVPVAAGFWSLRPQLFGYIFFVIVQMILERFRQGKSRILCLLPFVFLLWVNTHGTFVFGFLALGIAWVSGLRPVRLNGTESFVWSRSQRIELEVATLASVLALLVTPYRSQLAAYPLDIIFLQPANVANIQEWMPITSERFLTLTVLVLLLGFLISKILLRFHCRLDDLAFACIAAIAAFLHLRFVPLFLLVTVPLLALPLAWRFSPYDRSRDRAPLNAALIAIIGLALIYYFPSRENLEKACAAHYPVAALEHLDAGEASGHIFNEYEWGGYLAWSLVPREGVFIDGRADIYERAGVLDDYLSIARLESGSLRLLGKYDIATCLIRSDAPLATALAALSEWQLIYADQVSSLYVRRRIVPAGASAPKQVASTVHSTSGRTFHGEPSERLPPLLSLR